MRGNSPGNEDRGRTPQWRQTAEIVRQRHHIAGLMGQFRDIQQADAQDSHQRLAT
jgi:hypothetical protein